MKFHKMTLYKVPFDNSYNDVVDYHRYTRTGNVLTKSNLTRAHIIADRLQYFNSLSHLDVYDGTGDTIAYKSVKVVDDKIVCSVLGSYETISEYNYAVLYGPYKVTYCFINSFDSNNDSANSSTTLYLEIDHWTTNIADILLDTPEQFEEYAHDNAKVFNNKNDLRLPKEFITRNTFTYLVDDAILFARGKIDRDKFSPASLPGASTYYIDPADCNFITYYIPMFKMEQEGGSYIVRPIIGAYKDANNNVSWETAIINNTFFPSLSSVPYVHEITLTCFTPVGVIKASDYTVTVNNKVYMKATTFDTNEFTVTFGNITLYYAYNAGGCWLYSSTKPAFLPAGNEITSYTKYNEYVYHKGINRTYTIELEIKYFQFPYKVISLIYKGREYNITPEPTGNTTSPQVTVSFIKLDGEMLKIENADDIGDTIFISLNNSDFLPLTVDAQLNYNLTKANGDQTRAIATSLLAAIGGVALAPFTGGASIIGGITAAGGTIASYATKLKDMSKEADSFTNVSANSFDMLPSIFPRIKSKNLKDGDIEILTTMWRKYGYPIFESRQFTMHRFWYDYKQIKESYLPNITNPIARRKIENILNKGVRIWHFNAIGSSGNTSIMSGISDFSKNNPSNQDCEVSTN